MKVLSLLLFAAAAHAADVSQLSWITGCWSMQQGAITTEERWTPPVGGQMMGISRTIRTVNGASTVVFHEFIRIDTEQDGIYYSPRIGTQAAAVRFKLTQQSATEVIFENPTHDFPQRILYTKTSSGLTARIDGQDKGKSKAQDFPMKSVSCN